MAMIPPGTPPMQQGFAEEAARRYLAAFQQMVTLTSAGPLVVIGIYQIASGDSCGICQLISGDSQPDSESLSNTQSLRMAMVALGTFIVSLVYAVNGLRRVAALNVGGGPIYPAFFSELTVHFVISTCLFLIGIFISFGVLLFSG